MPLSALAPIRCPRLTVRPVTAEDLPDLLAVNGDDEATRFLPYAAWRGLDDARAWLARMEALHAAGGARQLVIERSADGRVVGTVLLFKHDEGSARVESGYVVGRPHWRSGYAREALAGVCGHAFAELGLRPIEGEVNPDNIASHRLQQEHEQEGGKGASHGRRGGGRTDGKVVPGRNEGGSGP